MQLAPVAVDLSRWNRELNYNYHYDNYLFIYSQIYSSGEHRRWRYGKL
jgi:hypothetical protein